MVTTFAVITQLQLYVLSKPRPKLKTLHNYIQGLQQNETVPHETFNVQPPSTINTTYE